MLEAFHEPSSIFDILCVYNIGIRINWYELEFYYDNRSPMTDKRSALFFKMMFQDKAC